MNNRFLTWLLIFLGVWFAVQFLAPAPKPVQQDGEKKAVLVEATKSTFTLGDAIQVKVTNNTEQAIALPSHCPKPPLTVYFEDSVREGTTQYSCEDISDLAAGQSLLLDYAPWSSTVFDQTGNYRIELPVTIDNEERTFVTYFRLENPGFFRMTWDALFYRPIFNLLIFFTTVIPGGNIGFAIILLTIFFRLLLFIPNQKALESQKAMQKLQPELKAVQEKYKDDQQRLAQETMKVWKKHKVNPVGSCLPMLVQLPILIGVYYAVQNGTNIASVPLLYEPLKFVNIEQINTLFVTIPGYTLDLALRDPWVLPIVVAFFQFIQMKLAMPKQKQHKQLVIKKDSDKAVPDMQAVNSTMVYALPILLGFMTASFPAGVGLYWFVNTLCGIAQQFVVNKQR